MRSGLPLMNHINEGIRLLDAIGSSVRAMEAFCVHPLLQADSDLQVALQNNAVFLKHGLDPAAIVLAMEYRRVANLYLSHHCKSAEDNFELSCLQEVNEMLIADKVQNRKDFEVHHLNSHPDSETLDLYFKNWLCRLGISEARYQELISLQVTDGLP